MRSRMVGRSRFDLRPAAKYGNSGESFRLAIRNAKANDPAELLIYDEVGETYDGAGIRAKDVANFLANNRGKPIDVKINSAGGSVFDGLAIYNGLLDHDAAVTATITGVAGSISSIIPMAADKVRAFASSSVMIHRALCICIGNVADMNDCAKWLASLDNQLAGIYSAKTGRSAATMLGYMVGDVDGTLFDARTAAKVGLVDEIIGTDGSGARNGNPNRPSGLDRRLSETQRVALMKKRAAARLRVLEVTGH